MIDADEFVKTLSGSTAIVFHGDADGCSSAAILYLVIRRLHPKIVPQLFAPLQGGSRIGMDTAEKMKGFANVIAVDLGEKEARVIDFLTKKHGVALLWIDHHKDVRKPAGDFVYYNPHYLGPEFTVPPASAIVYKMFSRITGVADLCWIAAVGVVGDKGENRAPDVIDATFKKFPHLVGGRSFGELAILKRMVSLISSGRSFFGRQGSLYAVEALIEAGEAGDPSALLYGENGRKLREGMLSTYRIVREILDATDPFEKFGSSFLICEINVKAAVQNYLVSVLRRKFQDRVICVINHGTNPESVHVELRRSDSLHVDLRAAAQDIAEKLGGSGGGHKAAAGIRVSKKVADWPAVKNALIARFS